MKKDQMSKKTHYTILKCFTWQETRLLNFLMIILHWYLKQKNKATKGTGLKILTPKEMLQNYQ